MTLTEKIKSIDLIGLFKDEGGELHRQGDRHAGCCPFPFHTDDHPSFFVYPDNRFKCFGCGEYGDAMDFVRCLHGLTFSEGLRHLGIDHGTEYDHQKVIKFDRKRTEIRKHNRRESDLSFTLGTLIRQTRHAMAALTVDTLDEYAGLIDQLPYYEHAHDVLIQGTSDAKAEVINAFKDFQTITRNQLWNQDFDYKGWLRKCQQIGEPNEGTVKNFFR